MIKIKNSLFFIFILFFSFSAFSEQTVEEIIKERKSIFSKNYKIAKGINEINLKYKKNILFNDKLKCIIFKKV